MSDGLRDRLLEATLSVVADAGLDAASVRRVAEQANVSIGAVQHHFPTKNALLLAAMDTVNSRVRDRLNAVLEGGSTAEGTLRALVAELVPTDRTRREEGRVWLAFVARAAVDPALQAVHARDWGMLEDTLTTLVASHDGPRTHAARDDARLLLAAVDGLAVGGLVEPDRLRPEHILAVVDRLLDDLLAPPVPAEDPP